MWGSSLWDRALNLWSVLTLGSVRIELNLRSLGWGSRKSLGVGKKPTHLVLGMWWWSRSTGETRFFLISWKGTTCQLFLGCIIRTVYMLWVKSHTPLLYSNAFQSLLQSFIHKIYEVLWVTNTQFGGRDTPPMCFTYNQIFSVWFKWKGIKKKEMHTQ